MTADQQRILEAATGEAPVAAFDFDGTLTVRDSFTAFLRWRAGARGYAIELAMLAPNLVSYLFHRDRGRIKAHAVRRFLFGLSREQLAADARAFAEVEGPRLFRPDALATWDDWKRKGAKVVIVTASPTILVAPFADRLGADLLLGTQLEFDTEDRVAGALMGENNRGMEKVRRLRQAFGPNIRLAAAYGDSSGDTEMLQIADIKGYRVFKGRP
ncbi:MAG: HAD-IB family hydrolase [Phenylobacterium sp.]|uniref:HAD-IB family hydrolase n=1 Tax=Phenylobacterium sp. TaxID=1871053 RepID=UPI002A2585ED|nr:HAD-IB family hydrolase [Phenylobacterium sp.]MDD3836217.1 HAD-IB family hydrolase [Phenylobacterium sp.]MDX9998038.1 HAD-IB family hydrolase [Phenylobacterium sp.]